MLYDTMLRSDIKQHYMYIRDNNRNIHVWSRAYMPLLVHAVCPCDFHIWKFILNIMLVQKGPSIRTSVVELKIAKNKIK